MYYIKSLVKWNYLILLLANSVNYCAEAPNQESQISSQNIAQLVSPTTMAWDMMNGIKEDEVIDRKCSLFINYCKNCSVDLNTLVRGKSFIYRALKSVSPKKWLLAVLEAGADPNYFFTGEDDSRSPSATFVGGKEEPLVFDVEHSVFTPLFFICSEQSFSISESEDTPWSKHGSSSIELCRILLERGADPTLQVHIINHRVGSEDTPRQVEKHVEECDALEKLIKYYHLEDGTEKENSYKDLVKNANFYKDLVKLFAIQGEIGSWITGYEKNDIAIFAIKEAINHHTRVQEFLVGHHAPPSYCASLPRELKLIIADYLPKAYRLQELLKEVE